MTKDGQTYYGKHNTFKRHNYSSSLKKLAKDIEQYTGKYKKKILSAVVTVESNQTSLNHAECSYWTTPHVPTDVTGILLTSQNISIMQIHVNITGNECDISMQLTHGLKGHVSLYTISMNG